MPAYSFKERFIPLIKNGTKKQTIRAKRKGQAKPGDTLYLYYGMRTKWCTKIAEAMCINVSEIIILPTGVFVGGELLEENQLHSLAIADGFMDWDDMITWWLDTNGLPFKGDIIFWNKLNK